MEQISPALIEQTNRVFENRIGQAISNEEARQAIENISGFFRVLQEWAEAERSKGLQGPAVIPDQHGGAAR